MPFTPRRLIALALLALTGCTLAGADELNPAAVTYTLPDQIKWKTPLGIAPGVENAVLVGDPTQPGFMWSWSGGSQAIISATRISIPMTASLP
jgi:hypothetical protein